MLRRDIRRPGARHPPHAGRCEKHGYGRRYARLTLSASPAIYTNAASAAFSRQRLQLSGSCFSPDDRDCYIASGQYNIDNRNFLLSAGWRQYRIDAHNNNMSADLGYTRRIDDRWAVGVTARYLRVKAPHAAPDALAADLSVLHILPLEGIGHYTTFAHRRPAGRTSAGG